MFKGLSKSYNQNLLPIIITIIIAMMTIVMGANFLKIEALSEQIIKSNNQNTTNTNLLRTMTEAGLNRHIALLKLIKSDDPFEREEIFTKINELATTFTVAREEMMKQPLSDEQIKLFKKQGSVAKNNLIKEDKIYDLLFEDRFKEANHIFYNVTAKDRYQNIIILEKISNIQNQIGQANFFKLKQIKRNTYRKLMLSMITSLLVSILLAVLIVRLQKLGNKKLTVLANSDSLTNLPNRSRLIKSVENNINREPNKTFALIFLDIDYFKNINDNYGHDIGDEILKHYSKKILSTISKNDILSRFGGDEFVLLLRSIDTKEEAVNVVARISKLLDTSYHFEHKEIFSTSSIGATLYTPDGDCKDAKALLSQADNAMYLAKKSGRNCYYFFSKETHRQMQREHKVDHDLHLVLKEENADQQLYMTYQPLYDLKDLSITSFEALIRWKNEEGNLIAPDEFIPIAEKTNLIEKINLLVIKEVCEQKAKWNKARKYLNIRINFNLSGNKNSFDDLLKSFKEHIKMHNLSYDDFGIELTERTILEVEKDTASEMKRLTNKGLKILIDDFGTGYSSLSYLKKLPITTIKIDKSFISGLPYNKDDKELVNTIITLGKSFKLDIIGEGVETKEQLKYLQQHSCQIAQGYYLNKPMNVNDIDNLSKSDHTLQLH